MDTAGQKGTGKWTGIAAFDLGVPVTLIAEAVFARDLSALKEQRMKASVLYGVTKKPVSVDKASFIEKVKHALYASKIVGYAQGFMLMQAAAKERGWALNYGTIALLWRGGVSFGVNFWEIFRKHLLKWPIFPAFSSMLFFIKRLTGV